MIQNAKSARREMRERRRHENELKENYNLLCKEGEKIAFVSFATARTETFSRFSQNLLSCKLKLDVSSPWWWMNNLCMRWSRLPSRKNINRPDGCVGEGREGGKSWKALFLQNIPAWITLKAFFTRMSFPLTLHDKSTRAMRYDTATILCHNIENWLYR